MKLAGLKTCWDLHKLNPFRPSKLTRPSSRINVQNSNNEKKLDKKMSKKRTEREERSVDYLNLKELFREEEVNGVWHPNSLTLLSKIFVLSWWINGNNLNINMILGYRKLTFNIIHTYKSALSIYIVYIHHQRFPNYIPMLKLKWDNLSPLLTGPS